MGKACGVARRRRKNANPRFHHKSKFAKAKKKLILRQVVKDPLVREGWNLGISKARNLKEIGITDNPNKVLPVPKPIEGLLRPKKKKQIKVPSVTEPKRKGILEKIEERSQRKKALRFHFGPNLVTWLTKMMSKHGDDYKAMERDPENHYQHSAGFIRKKIKQFLTNPITADAYDQAMESIETDIKPKKQKKKPEPEPEPEYSEEAETEPEDEPEKQRNASEAESSEEAETEPEDRPDEKQEKQSTVEKKKIQTKKTSKK